MKTGLKTGLLGILLLAAAFPGAGRTGAPAAPGVVVLDMEDASIFSASDEIRPLVIEEKEGVRALRMSFKCEGSGMVAVRHRFESDQDWTGYSDLRFNLYAESTSRISHFQVQLFDASNNVMLYRRHLRSFNPNMYGQWREAFWNFGSAKPHRGDSFDFSRVRMIYFTVWQDHYGHSAGDEVSYWIGELRRVRSLEKTGLGASPAPEAPRLDGVLDDECWRHAHAAEQFYLPGEAGLPQSGTSVRVLWDDENIYFGLRAYSELLEVDQQRIDDFAASVTDRDGGVFRDDSLEIFLASAAEPDEYLHFAVNALGTRYDGRLLDRSWDGDWEAACEIHDGYWTAEIAIPWATLGMDPGRRDYLRANFFRNDPNNRQSSGWSPVEASHHAPDAFGYIQLLRSVPAISVSGGVMPEMRLGENFIKPVFRGITGGSAAVRLAVTQDEETGEKSWEFGVSPGAEEIVEIPVEVSSAGEISVAYSIVDAETDDLYYQSPRHVFTTDAVAGIRVSVRGEAEVFHDGVSLGRGADRSFDAFLRAGANVIALEAGRPVEAAVLHGDGEPDASGWKQSREAPEGWMLPSFDDSGWEQAKVSRGRLDPAAGRYFRKVVAAGSTRLLSLGDTGNVHLLTGSSQHLPLFVSSPSDRALERAKLVVMLPPGLEWIEWEDKTPAGTMGAFSGYEVSPERVGRETWTRVEFKWDRLEPLEWTERTRPNIALVVRTLEPLPAERLARFWVEGEEGYVRELPLEIPLTVHPAFEARSPENIPIWLWHSFGAGGYMGAELEALVDTWKSAGFNTYVERTYFRDYERYYPLLKEKGMRIIAERHPRRMRELVALRSDENRFGHFDPQNPYRDFPVCNSWAFMEGRELFTDAVASYFAPYEIKPEGLMMDLEFPVRSACFCDRCLRRFEDMFDIGERVTRETIFEKYSDEWTEWVCRLWGDVVDAMREGVRKGIPDGKMFIYSAYQTERSRERYSIDWNYVAPSVDVASAGYGINDRIMADTLDALDSTPLIGGVLYYLPRRDPNLKLQYIYLMMAGADGAHQYAFAPMDGLDYLRVARVATFLADNEEFFLRGVQDNERLSGPPTGVARALRMGNELLVVLVNSSPQARTFSLSVAGASGDFKAYGAEGMLAQSSLHSAGGASVTVGPHGFAAFTGRVER